MERTVKLLVTVVLDDDDDRTPEQVRQEVIDDLGGIFAPQVDLLANSTE